MAGERERAALLRAGRDALAATTVRLHRAITARAPAGAGVVWSPYSVASALALVAGGAEGRTRAEFTALLGELEELGAVLRPAAALESAGGTASPGELAVVNTVWLSDRLEPRPGFLTALRSWPAGALRQANFTDAERVRGQINDEVATLTRGLIRELLPLGALTASSRVVAVNALWLRVAWWPDFADHATVAAPFQAPDGQRSVPTMCRTGMMRYRAAGGWRAVTLTTTGPVVVDILLPDGDLTEAEAELTPELLHSLGEGEPTDVELRLPRFRLRADVPLGDVLVAAGLGSAFSDAADFSALTTTEPVTIDQVLHQAVLTVDEHGLEGAAATAVVMITASARHLDPVPFHVDRPFLVVARHQDTGAIYFLGRVTQP